VSERGWEVASLDEIAGPRAGQGYEWHPVRRHVGIGSFGANANVAREAGDDDFAPLRGAPELEALLEA
jgi:hypothetical protein